MIKKKFTSEQALQKLRHYCRYQERCQSEVRDKLFELGINKSWHDEMIGKLSEENYLNEERFSIAYANGRFKMKQWGKKKIQFELRKKRINEEVIQTGLKQIDDDEYVQTLQNLAEEKYTALKSDQYLVRKKKTMDYLLQKGFEFELIKTLVEKIAN